MTTTRSQIASARILANKYCNMAKSIGINADQARITHAACHPNVPLSNYTYEERTIISHIRLECGIK
jgi:hypothetical protein